MIVFCEVIIDYVPFVLGNVCIDQAEANTNGTNDESNT